MFLLFACLYILSIGQGFYSSDGEVMFKTAAALVERRSFALQPDPGLPQIVQGHDGRFYSKYDPGLPLLLAPLYVTGDWIAQVNHAHRYMLAATFALLVPALAGAGTLAALNGLPPRMELERTVGTVGASCSTPLQKQTDQGARFFTKPPPDAVERGRGGEANLPVLAAGIASPLWVYARVLFTEAVLACVLTLTVWTLLRRRDTRRESRHFLAAGMVFGAGVLTRAALVIYLPALLVLMLRRRPNKARRADMMSLLYFGVGLLPFMIGLAAHNMLRFDAPLHFGYAGEGFTTPFGQGIAGLLFSPGRSVFAYAPPLILSLGLWPRFRRAYPALGDFLAVAWIVALVFYGAWWAWHGGWSWGPRFLVPLIPLSMLPLIMLPERRRWQIALAALMLLGALIQVAGVFTDLTPHYAALTRDGETDYAALHYDLSQIPPVASMQRLARGQTVRLAIFHLGDTGLPPTWTTGVPALLLAGLVTLALRSAYSYRSHALSLPLITKEGR